MLLGEQLNSAEYNRKCKSKLKARTSFYTILDSAVESVFKRRKKELSLFDKVVG